MPKRLCNRTYRVPTPSIQGEGSWVEVLPITYAEGQPIPQLEGQSSRDYVDYLNEREAEMLEEHIVAWNWVDNDGNPYEGKPSEHFRELFYMERAFLIAIIVRPNRDEQKNS